MLVAAEHRLKRSSTNSDPNRRDRLTHVSCDGAEWIHGTIRKHCSNAEICLDAFHVVRWAQDAVDEIRREVWNGERRGGDKEAANLVKGTRSRAAEKP